MKGRLILFAMAAILLIISAANAQEAWERIDVAENFGGVKAALCPGDFNGDGLVDIAGFSGLRMHWWENQGNNQWEQHLISAQTPRASYGVLESADLDSDGDLDLVYTANTALYWVRNDDNGNFSEIIPIGYSSWGHAAPDIADLDGDGDMDVVVSIYGARMIRYYINDGEENFSPNWIGGFGSARGTGVADFNGDGRPDIIAGGVNSNIYMFTNNGGNDFSLSMVVENKRANDFSIIDMDDDGDVDVVFHGHWMENDGNGSFELHPGISGKRPLPVDLDNDGDFDLVGGNTGAYFLNDGDFNFTGYSLFAPYLYTTLKVGDFNNDGAPDILRFCGSYNWKDVHYYINNIAPPPVGDISVEPLSLDFDGVDVNNSSDLTVTISNEGNGDITVSDIASDNDAFTTDFGGEFTLGAGENQDVTVTFAPDVYGDFAGTLTITSDDPDEGTVTVDLTGVGLAPDVELSDEAVEFGDVEFKRTATMSFDISNVGNADLVVNGMVVGNEEFAIDFGDALTIEPGGSVTVGVVYNANTQGDVFGEIGISSNDPVDPEVTVDLMGTSVWVSEFELLSRICDRAWQLRDERVINRGQANSICVKPCHAERHLRRNNTRTAINNLNALINHIEDFVEEGVLSGQDGAWFVFETNFIIDLINEFGVAGQGGQDLVSQLIPETVQIESVYPNPFNSSTNIRYGLPEEANISVEVFDISGRRVAELVNGSQPAGYHTVAWNANGFSVGVYFVKYTNSSNVLVSKVLLTK